MWPRTELFCCTLQPVAFTLLALHLLGARLTPLQCSYLFQERGTCFQLDSRLEKGTLISHKCQRLSAVFPHAQKYRTVFLGGGRTLMLRLQGDTLQPQLQTLRFLSRVSTEQCHTEGRQGLIYTQKCVNKEREKYKFRTAHYSNEFISRTRRNMSLHSVDTSSRGERSFDGGKNTC